MNKLKTFKEEYQRRKKKYDEKQRRLFEFLTRKKNTLLIILCFVVALLLLPIIYAAVKLSLAIFMPGAGILTETFLIIFGFLFTLGFLSLGCKKAFLSIARLEKDWSTYGRNNEKKK